jgi:hypothetical protein
MVRTSDMGATESYELLSALPGADAARGLHDWSGGFAAFGNDAGFAYSMNIGGSTYYYVAWGPASNLQYQTWVGDQADNIQKSVAIPLVDWVALLNGGGLGFGKFRISGYDAVDVTQSAGLVGQPSSLQDYVQRLLPNAVELGTHGNWTGTNRLLVMQAGTAQLPRSRHTSRVLINTISTGGARMTGINTAEIIANLRIVAMILALTGIDWILGILLAIRAGVFNLQELPGMIRVWGTEILGLSLAAVATGLTLKFGDVDASVVLVGLFLGAAGVYSVRLLDHLRQKIVALETEAAARAYFRKPERDA